MGVGESEGFVRLAELRALEPGWLDGEGEPVSDRAAQGARALLGYLVQPVRPRLYPTEDGGVRIEWTVGARDLSVEVDAEGRFYGHVLDLEHRSEDETEGDAIDDAASFLRR